MDYNVSIEEYDDVLTEVADRIYAARRAFLRTNFDGYVANTYYYIPDGGYYCWPAQSNGRFEGFTDLIPEEKTVVDDLEDLGFELLGVGVNRVVCECPVDFGEDVVVKFGRCGMGESYGAGRIKNLIEYQISTSTNDLPLVLSQYCDPNGKYAIYPKAEPVVKDELETSEISGLKSTIDGFVPGLNGEEINNIENLGRLEGEICVLDYSEFDDFEYPMGIPDHIDSETVIREVDELRRQNKKRDIKTPGKLVTPAIAID
jgi:hypothetical protein